jgi:ABC-type spermidine/putrescine transport system permease subunit II
MVTELETILAEYLKLLPFFIPVIIIEYGLMIYALVQAVKNEVMYLPRWGWILIIVFINIIGPIVFLIIGRKKDIEND